MEKMTASRLLLCAAALMALSGILMAVCGRFVCAVSLCGGAVYARHGACLPCSGQKH